MECKDRGHCPVAALSPHLRRFVSFVVCLSIICLAGSVAAPFWPTAAPPSASRLASVAALSAAAFALRLDIRLGSHRWVLAWSDTALVFALLLLPIRWAVLTTAAGKAAGAAATFLRHQPIKLAFNTASHAIAGTLAVAVAASVGQLPFDIHDGRDVLALLLAGAVYDLASNALTASVIAVANGTSAATVWRAGLGLQTLTMIGNLAATASALALAALDERFIFALPAIALVLQQAYRAVQRSRMELESGRRLADAINALGHLDENTVLSHTAAQAAALLAADSAEVLIPPARGDEPAAAYSAANSRQPGPWWTEAVPLLGPDTDQPIGEIRVHFTQPPQLTDRERGLLITLAAATRNALAAARAHADAEHLAEALAHEVTHDPVTTLPTRQLLLEHLDVSLDRAQPCSVGLILIGLPELGEVARTLGHETRDHLLRQAAARLREATTAGEFAARLDDNQFAVFVPEVGQLQDLRTRADSLLAALAAPTSVDAGTVILQTTAGLAYARPSTIDPTELLRQATVAATATARTNSPIEYYRPAEDTTSGPNALLVTAELQDALRDSQLILYYQPIIDLHTGRPLAAEALVHWIHPSRGMLPPDTFVAVLEQATLLRPYTDWLLQEAAAERARWTELDNALPVSVNLSARCLLDRELPAHITHAVHTAGIRPHQLMLEFSEPTALLALPTVDTVLEELHELGIRVAIDDFGSGPGSLVRLLRVPATDLKITPQLVAQIIDTPQARAIIRAAREIADSIGLRVTAVGVPTAPHILAAHDAGAHAAQGTAICPPLTASRAYAYLLERTHATATTPTAQVIQLHPSNQPPDPA